MEKRIEKKMKKTNPQKTNQTIHPFFLAKDPAIDGILVTVGLCIIALLLCVVMKDSLTSFIQTIVSSMTSKANGILNGTGM